VRAAFAGDFNWINLNVNFFSIMVVVMMMVTPTHNPLRSTVETVSIGVVVTWDGVQDREW
jgi:hypothetical protein